MRLCRQCDTDISHRFRSAFLCENCAKKRQKLRSEAYNIENADAIRAYRKEYNVKPEVRKRNAEHKRKHILKKQEEDT